MKVTPAEILLNKVNFNSYDDWETYPEAEYKCDCGQLITINYRDLKKHGSSDFTHFKAQDVLFVETLVDETIRSETSAFLDWYCPRCQKPVRIYYLFWAGGRHGEEGYLIKYIVN